MILGISTNTRLLGIAIIDNGDLLDYSIHLDKSAWSTGKVNSMLATLEPCVRLYCIKRVAVSIPYQYHQTKAFKLVVSRIERFFVKLNIPVDLVPIETIFSLCKEGEKKTKKAVMECLVKRFPKLTYYHNKERRNRRRYYIKVFEAVAVAATLMC